MWPVGAPQACNSCSLNSFWMRPIDLPAAELAVGANKYIRLRFTMLPTCQYKLTCQLLDAPGKHASACCMFSGKVWERTAMKHHQTDMLHCDGCQFLITVPFKEDCQ